MYLAGLIIDLPKIDDINNNDNHIDNGDDDTDSSSDHSDNNKHTYTAPYNHVADRCIAFHRTEILNSALYIIDLEVGELRNRFLVLN